MIVRGMVLSWLLFLTCFIIFIVVTDAMMLNGWGVCRDSENRIGQGVFEAVQIRVNYQVLNIFRAST